MSRLFGTDGVRDIANGALSPMLAFKLGRAGAGVLIGDTGGGRPRIVIGRDTRISGEMLFGALTAGITSVGADVLDVGIIPTPAVAYLTKELAADAGVVISASHNPVEYNGIKFFSREGFKLSDELEERIESYILGEDGGIDLYRADDFPSPVGSDVGRVYHIADAEDRYVEFVKSTTAVDFEGTKIVVDCANGAAYRIAPRVLRELGAEVISIFDQPDGTNINVSCGSTHPRAVSEAVVKCGADFGLAHDGDADRVLAINERGEVIDGDHIIAICGLHMLRQGKLRNNSVVVTMYSNMGLNKAFEDAGGQVVTTKAGDRYVLEAMREKRINLGGEQSGHIIFLDHNTTGDGIVTAIQLISVMKETGKTLSELAVQMETYPQIMVNVRVKDREGFAFNKNISAGIKRCEDFLRGEGRVVVRPSGTEPLVRVMAEGPDEERLKNAVYELAKIIDDELN